MAGSQHGHVYCHSSIKQQAATTAAVQPQPQAATRVCTWQQLQPGSYISHALEVACTATALSSTDLAVAGRPWLITASAGSHNCLEQVRQLLQQC